MIHVPRPAAPPYLATHGTRHAQRLCDERRDYYQSLAKHHRAGGAGNRPSKPRAKGEHYGHAQVRAALESVFGSKCAYCETEVRASGPQHIEHYRPQSVYPGLAYSWENLLLACAACNVTHKSDRFPVGPTGNTPEESRRAPCSRDDTDDALLLNPCRDRPEQHLTFRNGYVVTVNRSRRGHITRRVCGLNREPLVKDRRKVLKMLQLALDAYRDAERIGNAVRRAQFQAYLADMSVSGSEYAGMVRAELEREGIDWRNL
jgi:uncharacterized protein (TIGR02646 family)